MSNGRPEVDALGPEKLVHLHDAASGLQAIVVIDNTAAGTAIGGIRVAPDLTVAEVGRLARVMTYKNAAAGLPYGGAKSGILADPARFDRERVVRAFARAIRALDDYRPGPDIGTSERDMAYIHDEIGRACCLPRALGGLPVDELGITGFGVCVAARVAAEWIDLPLVGARVAVEGYGSVGRAAAERLAGEGAVVVAASDIHGATSEPAGLDIELLREASRHGRPLAEAGGRPIPRDALATVDCDILVPAARPDSITLANASGVRARLIVEGANIPVSREAERLLHARGVLCVPDFIANAGGMICISVEDAGLGEAEAFRRAEERIALNTARVLERAAKQEIDPREAAERTAHELVLEAMRLRGRLADTP